MLKYANSATTLLANSINESAEQIALSAGAGSLFPTLAEGDWFPLVVVDSSSVEFIRATARTGDLVSVTRAQEGTTAKSFSAGARVELRLTAAALTAIQDQLGTALTDALAAFAATLGEAAAADIGTEDGDVAPGDDGRFPPAGTNDRVLAWVSGAYAWVEAVAAMLADGAVTFAKVATDAIAAAADLRSGAASKLVSAAGVVSAAAEVTLTDAATIAVNWASFINGKVTLGGNRTLGNPGNPQVGTWRQIIVVQDGTGGRTLAYHANYKFIGGIPPVVANAAGAVTTLHIYCRTTTAYDVYVGTGMTS